MGRVLWLAVVATVTTIPLSLLTIAIAAVKSTSPVIDRVILLWARSLVAASGIKLRTENVERLDPATRYIFVCNHYSWIDIPCILAGIPGQPIRFMAKVSLFKIPIFGWALGRAGFIPIDRKNRGKAKKSFDLAADRIRKGNTIVIFPEEGRSKYREMKPFQRGAFLLAIRSHKTVVPLALDSTFDRWPVGSFWHIDPGVVTLRIGTPIETAAMSVRDKDRLLNEARRQIESMLFPSGPPASSPADMAASRRHDSETA
jgi:1-acyl-sn-glycerol-3-phosphate acyltransferase